MDGPMIFNIFALKLNHHVDDDDKLMALKFVWLEICEWEREKALNKRIASPITVDK